MRSRRVWKILVAGLLAIASVFTVVRTVVATPSPAVPAPQFGDAGQGECAEAHRLGRENPHCYQDPQWLALKNAGRINSGVHPGEPKGTHTAPYVMPSAPPLPGSGLHAASTRGASAARPMANTYSWGWCNDCSELNPTYTINVWEPGQGDYHNPPYGNFGWNTPDTDDHQPAQHYNNWNNADLCGPGAANNALWYWPLPPNGMSASATDPWTTNPVGYWQGTDPYDRIFRMRGYIVQLAWNIQAPTWPTNHYVNGILAQGMMQGGTSQRDSKVRDGMNWEASGENPNSSPPWQTYFYALNYTDSQGNAKLAYDVKMDVHYGNVPVVVLLNTHPLPNWGGLYVGHYVTIIGYNNDNSQYAYTDTCGNSTHCNPSGAGSDGGILTVDQNTLFNGMNIIDPNSTPYGGDWIW